MLGFGLRDYFAVRKLQIEEGSLVTFLGRGVQQGRRNIVGIRLVGVAPDLGSIGGILTQRGFTELIVNLRHRLARFELVRHVRSFDAGAGLVETPASGAISEPYRQ